MYKISPDTRYCGGGTFSFCEHEESEQWPKYIDPFGNKRCCVCNCIDKFITLNLSIPADINKFVEHKMDKTYRSKL